MGIETLIDPEEGENSAENNTSTILLLQIDDKKFLFTSDAGVEALNNAINKADNLRIDLSKIGFFQIGGGIAGDFPICVVPLIRQDMEIDCPLWSYFCQISESITSFGSYSGAVPNEKITWGKIDANTPRCRKLPSGSP